MEEIGGDRDALAVAGLLPHVTRRPALALDTGSVRGARPAARSAVEDVVHQVDAAPGAEAGGAAADHAALTREAARARRAGDLAAATVRGIVPRIDAPPSTGDQRRATAFDADPVHASGRRAVCALRAGLAHRAGSTVAATVDRRLLSVLEVIVAAWRRAGALRTHEALAVFVRRAGRARFARIAEARTTAVDCRL